MTAHTFTHFSVCPDLMIASQTFVVSSASRKVGEVKKALEAAGVTVCSTPNGVAEVLRERLGRRA